MDLGHVESAGIHNHGRLADTPSVDDSWARALLRRGWDLSRKAAVAGAAATAAPLVAPPLIVLSAAGIVLSIPFVAYLASLAGTNHLMGALLPPSTAQPYHTSDQQDDHLKEEFLDASEDYGQEAPAFGRWNTTQDESVKVENHSGSSLLLPRDPSVSEAPVPSLGDDDNVAQEEGEGEFSVQNSGQDLLVSNSGDKIEERTSMGEKKSTEYMPQQDNVVQSKEEVEVAVHGVVEQSNSNTNLVTSEVADVQVTIVATATSEGEVLPLSNLAACGSPAELATGEVFDMHVDVVTVVEPQSEVLPPSNLAACDSLADLVTAEAVDVQVHAVAAAVHENEVLPVNLAACESPAVVETAHDGDIVGISVMEDIVMDFGDVNKERVERRFFAVASMVSVDDGEDVMSSGSTPNVSAIVNEMIDQPNQSTGVGYTVMNEVSGRNVVARCETRYTEEQLREQIDIIRTITGYGAAPTSTLEDELAGLYIFVGVEAPDGSRDTSDRLVELNAKLRFLKSIIGVD